MRICGRHSGFEARHFEREWSILKQAFRHLVRRVIISSAASGASRRCPWKRGEVDAPPQATKQAEH